MMYKMIAIALAVFLQMHVGASYLLAQTGNITRQETLRGSVTPEREWWDVLHYHLKVEFLPQTQRLRGSNTITFKTLKPGSKMQIDLQPPLSITKITHRDSQLKFEREGNVYWVMFGNELAKGVEDKVEIFYEGVPVVSKNPPWVGGITWGRDDLGEHFIVTTCQGIGASIWWPNKDHGADEPDRGMQTSVTVPDRLTAVSNGRLKKTDHNVVDKKKTFHWEVLNPINNYAVNVNIGNYVHFSEKYQGKGGVLDVDYWVLAHQKDRCFEECGFDSLPATGPGARAERDQNGDDRKHPAGDVHHRRSRSLGAPARPGHEGQAGHHLDHLVQREPFFIGALEKALEAAEDESRIQPEGLLVPQPEPLHGPWREVLDQYVRARDQSAADLPAVSDFRSTAMLRLFRLKYPKYPFPNPLR